MKHHEKSENRCALYLAMLHAGYPIDIFMLEQNSLYEDLDNQDQSATHFLGYNQKLIAYGRMNIDPEKNNAVIRRICIEKNYRSQKLGSVIMQKIMDYIAKQKNIKTAELDAQFHLQKFYEGFGFSAVGAPYDDGGVMHIQMTKTYH